MYAVRGRLYRRCLIGLFFGPGALLTVVALVLLFAGGWVTVGAAAFLAAVIARTAFVRLEAGPEGMVVVNRFFRHRIAWSDLSAVWSTPRRGIDFFPVVALAPRRLPWFRISAY